MLLVALCIIGYFVYKKYFATSYNFGNDNFGNDNNSADNFVADNFDKADLEILNMPVPEVSPSK